MKTSSHPTEIGSCRVSSTSGNFHMEFRSRLKFLLNSLVKYSVTDHVVKLMILKINILHKFKCRDSSTSRHKSVQFFLNKTSIYLPPIISRATHHSPIACTRIILKSISKSVVHSTSTNQVSKSLQTKVNTLRSHDKSVYSICILKQRNVTALTVE